MPAIRAAPGTASCRIEVAHSLRVQKSSGKLPGLHPFRFYFEFCFSLSAGEIKPAESIFDLTESDFRPCYGCDAERLLWCEQAGVHLRAGEAQCLSGGV